MRGAVAPDHIHMLVAAPPQLAPAKLAQFLKGRSSPGVARRISRTAQTVLGTTPVGARILLRDGGRGG